MVTISRSAAAPQYAPIGVSCLKIIERPLQFGWPRLGENDILVTKDQQIVSTMLYGVVVGFGGGVEVLLNEDLVLLQLSQARRGEEVAFEQLPVIDRDHKCDPACCRRFAHYGRGRRDEVAMWQAVSEPADSLLCLATISRPRFLQFLDAAALYWTVTARLVGAGGRLPLTWLLHSYAPTSHAPLDGLATRVIPGQLTLWLDVT